MRNQYLEKYTVFGFLGFCFANGRSRPTARDVADLALGVECVPVAGAVLLDPLVGLAVREEAAEEGIAARGVHPP